MQIINTVSSRDPARRLLVYHADRAGWIICEERSGEVSRRLQYKDWHRVERAVWMFTIDARPAAPATADTTKVAKNTKCVR